ncbi:MAG: deoxyribodipyrimidine photo-lyase [Actinomycetota bacterium]
MRVLVLFTRDLRVHDHPALWEACNVATEVVPLFVVDPDLTKRSPNRARFLSECLVDLDRALTHRGGRLFVREGDVAAQAANVAAQASCDAIFVTGDAGSYAAGRSARITALGASGGFGLRTFTGHAVVDPGTVAPRDASAYRVFTPYLRAWANTEPRIVLGAPRNVRVPRDLEAGRLPSPDRWRPTALELAPGGEAAGRKRMQRFLSTAASTYAEGRNDLAGDVTSRLSPYLRFGCISATELLSKARGVAGAQEFIRQLAWRDFFLQLLADRPSMSWHDLRPGVPEQEPVDDRILEAWTTGRTGLPLVDAGMRQLLREGWMHNRARLVTASFLTRRAGVAWQEGARHFFHHLVDGDHANNAGNWQWVAGTGAAPRQSRPLNPARQAERFDADGRFVRRYVPELASADTAAILRPWRHPDLLRATGYPAPLLDVPDGGEPSIARSTVRAAAVMSVPR